MLTRLSKIFTTRTVGSGLARGLALLISTLAVLVGLAVYLNAVNQAEQELQRQADQLTQTLSIVLPNPIWNIDTALIAQIGEAYLKNDNVVGVSVKDTSGATLFEKVEGKYDFLKSSSLYFEGQVIGSVTVYMSRAAERVAQNIILITTFTVVVLLIVLIVVASALLLERLLNQPLQQLIAGIDTLANGKYDYRFSSYQQTDLNRIVSSINLMAEQIEERDRTLEQRVAERTSELTRANEQSAQRTAQLETVADIAHSIASIQDQAQLLPRITQIISERFGFYHVGIFLLDKEKGFAVLRAANSPGGQRMLNRGHKLKVGQVGIVGHVTATGEARIALDVGQDSVYFDNADLPETRSEMAVPLMVGKTIIGALDVQSIQAGAFSQEDIALLKTLADQVSIAIENSRLYGETKQALERLQFSQSQYLQQAWEQISSERRRKGYRIEEGMLSPLKDAIPAELWKLIVAGRPIVASPKNQPAEFTSATETSLTLPINLRGQIIGAISLAEEAERRWTQDEISLAEAVADQVALALENARLIEETSRRAERELLVSSITTKLRSTNDPQAILQIAASELRQALRAKHAQVLIPNPSATATPPGQIPGEASSTTPSEHPQDPRGEV